MFYALITEQKHNDEERRLVAITNRDIDTFEEAFLLFHSQYIGLDVIDYFEGSTSQYLLKRVRDNVRVKNILDIKCPAETTSLFDEFNPF